MSDNVTIVLLADAINRVATAINALGGGMVGLGVVFFLFKKMSGHDEITIKKEDKPAADKEG